MAYDPDPAATHDPATGVVVPANWLDLINSNFAELGAAWTSDPGTWGSASDPQPSIGNGSLDGAYLLIGKTYYFRVQLVIGSTTTLGTGQWFFELPGSPNLLTGMVAGGRGVDASDGAKEYGLWGTTKSNDQRFYLWSGDSATHLVGATDPITWATGDQINFNGVFEVI